MINKKNNKTVKPNGGIIIKKNIAQRKNKVPIFLYSKERQFVK